MPRTVTIPGGDSDIMAWVTEHGLNPHHLTKTVTLNDDGTITFHRILRQDGKPLIVDNEMATRAVTVTPRRPFPLDLGDAQPRPKLVEVATVGSDIDGSVFVVTVDGRHYQESDLSDIRTWLEVDKETPQS